MLFRTLLKLRDYEQFVLPFIQSQVDRDIIVEIGAAEEGGRLLNLKQLTLLNLGSLATLRRRIARLVKLDVLEREEHQNDGRVIVYRISRKYLSRLKVFASDLKFIACYVLFHEETAERACDAVQMVDAMDSCALIDRLKTFCAKHGQLRRIRMTCKEQQGFVFVMIDIDGDVHAVARELKGQVFGMSLVCTKIAISPAFKCADGPTQTLCPAEWNATEQCS